MLTDEKKTRILARFDIFRRPMPKMSALQKSSADVLAYWGRGVPLNENQIQDLWRKLDRERAEAVINDRELAYLGRVVFTTVAQGLKPLLDVPLVLAHVADTLRKRERHEKSREFVRSWFNHFPAQGVVPQDGCDAMVALVKSIPGLEPLAENGLVLEDGPAKAAAMIRKDETLRQGIERVGEGFISPDSRFSELAWTGRFSGYKAMVATASMGTEDDMRLCLRILTADSIDRNGLLRDQSMLKSFTRNVLGYFLENPDVIPNAFARLELMKFFERFLGSRKDPINASRWHPIADFVNPLFDFWEMGLQLENIFEFAREAVESEAVGISRSLEDAKTATRHWTERREFWLRYWRAGRFKRFRVYATTSTRRREFSWLFEDKYPEVISNLGMIYGHPGSTLMFLFELRGNVMISEFSDMGALRIGYGNSRVTPELKHIYWEDIKNFPEDSIAHQGYWKPRTDAAIAALTMESVPR